MQGKGIGAKLLQCAFEQAKKMNCRTIQLDAVSNQPAVKFYQKMGMEILTETYVPKLQEAANIGPSCRMYKDLNTHE